MLDANAGQQLGGVTEKLGGVTKFNILSDLAQLLTGVQLSVVTEKLNVVTDGVGES